MLFRSENLGGREEQPARITFRIRKVVDPQMLSTLPGLVVDPPDENGLRDAYLETRHPVEDLNSLTGAALTAGIDLVGLEVRRPTLEDVYLEMTDVEATDA